MSKESIHENDSAVKNKNRTRRTIPPSVPRFLRDFPKLSKRARAGKESPGYLLKADFIDWLSGYPGMTHAFWKVARVIVSHYKFKLGKAWPSIQYVSEMANANPATVKRAVKFFHDQGIIFTQSGGLGGGGLTRSSHYVPHFSLFLNDETGAIIGNAPYRTPAENWAVAGVNFPAGARGCAESVAQNELPKAVAQNEPPESPTNRQKDGVSVAQNEPLRSDSVVGGASASPARADAPSVGAPHRKEDSENENGKPADSDYSQPTVHASEEKSILSYVCHTLAEWDAALSPNNPDRALASRYVANDLPPAMFEAVESNILKTYKSTCKHSPDLAPFENLPENAVRLYYDGKQGGGIERENLSGENHGPDTPLFVYSIY